MSVPFLIVDGYNLMHATGVARVKFGPGELERVRNEFLKLLAESLSERERNRTTIVFDAAEAPAFVSRQATVDAMQVLFATPGGDADSLIESLVAAHSAPRQVRVVSSDRRLQAAARRRRGSFVTSEAFLVELEKKSRAQERRSTASGQLEAKFGGEISPQETARWLKVFGDIPEAELLKKDSDKRQQRVNKKRGKS